MKLIILNIILATYALGSPVEQSLVFNQDGSYKFNYDTGVQEGRHSRQEVRNADGSVEGSYSYEDPDGNVRVVNYRAGRQGFVASGDVGVPGAPKTQLPLVEPTVDDEKNIDPNAQKHDDETTTAQPQLEDVTGTTTTVKPAEEKDVTKAPLDEGSYKREAGVPQFYGQQDIFNTLPLSTPFGRRRLGVPDKVGEDAVHDNEQSPHLSNADVSDDGISKDKPETPAKEVPAKPGHGQPLSFIYTVGSPFVPSLLHVAPQGGDDKPVQKPVVDGKGAAKYYVYVPSHHYFGTPSYFYLPQGEVAVKPEDKPNQDSVSKPEEPSSQHNHHHSNLPSPQVPVAPISPIQYHQPHLTAVRYQPAQVNQVNHGSQGHQVQPVAQYFQGLPLSYHTEIHHTVPAAPGQGQGAPQESVVALKKPLAWSYTPQLNFPLVPGAPQESVSGANHPWAYNVEVSPQSEAVPVAQGHGSSSSDAASNKERPPTVLTYIQPDSVKYVPAEKQDQPQVKVQADALLDNVVPASAGVQSVDQPTLRRPVYHHYVFKGPNASYGYHYQY